MIKKAVLAGSLVTLLLLIAVVFFKVKNSEAPITDPLSAIPTDAAFILKSNEPLETWDKLSTTNIMWEELMPVPQIGMLHAQFSAIDTLVIQYPEIKDYLSSQGFLLSIHPNENSEFNLLFAFGIPKMVDPKQAEKILLNLVGNNRSNSTYQNVDLYSTSTNSQLQINYTFVNDLLLISADEALLKKAIDQSLSGKSITDNPNFQKCYESRGVKEEANVVISYKNISQIVGAGLQQSKLIPQNIHHFGTWATTDLTLRPNELHLHGFTALDTSAQFLATFKGQKAQPAKMFGALPEKTASIIHFSFSNFKSWYEAFRKYLDARNKLGQLDDTLIEQDEFYDIFIEDNILEWVESEMAQAVVYRNKSLQDTLIVLRSSNPEFGYKKMIELSAKANYDIDNVYPADQYPIVEIGIPNLANLIFGDLFPQFETTYCVQNKNYIFLTNSMAAAERLTSDFEQRKYLNENAYFNEYAENIPESNYMIYSNIATSYESFKHHTSTTPRALLAQHESILKKFQALTMSWSNENDDLFYQNVYLKFNPIFKEESNSIWEFRLGGTSVMKPSLVKNHYTNAKEIFIQDSKNKVYLISNTGKLLWEKQLDEKIESEVIQIDIYKNNKLQMAFNTRNKIYVLDRNGENVSGFPVTLDAPATNTLSVIDYDQSKEYRLLIACENNKLYNFDKKGVKVDGWAYQSEKSPVIAPVRLITVKGKDYLIAATYSGKVNALDRKGKVRIPFKGSMKLSKNNDYTLVNGKSLDKSFIIGTDSIGNVIKLFLDNRKEVLDLGNFNANHYFKYADINLSGAAEYIFTEEDQLTVFDQAGKVVIEQTFEQSISFPNLYNMYNQVYIGVNSESEIWMIDRTGNPLKGFPMKGSLPFSVSDINKDGKSDLIAQDNEGNILVYEIEQN